MKRSPNDRSVGQRRPIKVIVLDDDHDFLEFFRDLFDETSGPIQIVGLFCSGQELRQKSAQITADVALIDIRLGDTNGVIIARELRALYPNLRIILMTGAPVPLYLPGAIQIGICGFLEKPFSAATANAIINCAAQGLHIFSKSAAEELTKSKFEKRDKFVQKKKLDQREVSVLEDLSAFLENKEIASHLCISVPLAEKLIRRVFQKLGVRCRSEAILLWHKLQGSQAKLQTNASAKCCGSNVFRLRAFSTPTPLKKGPTKNL